MPEILYAGLDGGGTKTALCLMDAEKNRIATLQGRAINRSSQSADAVREALLELLSQLSPLCGGLTRLGGLCVGAAGVSLPGVPEFLESVVREGGCKCPVYITGDQVAAMAGALKRPYGAILISGTGSICYGRDKNGGEKRTGGWGHIIGDEGSGYAIGRAILSASARAFDGRSPATLLLDSVLCKLHVKSLSGVLEYVYAPQRVKKDIAAFAPLLDDACAQNDAAALKIAEQAGRELALLCRPVIMALGMENGELAMAGSILLKSPWVRGATEAALAETLPGLRCVTPKESADYGAALLAMEYRK